MPRPQPNPPARNRNVRDRMFRAANAVLGFYGYLFMGLFLIVGLLALIGAVAFTTDLIVKVLRWIPSEAPLWTTWATTWTSLPPIYGIVAAFLIVLVVAFIVAVLTESPPPARPKEVPPPRPEPRRRLTTYDRARQISDRLLARHQAMQRESESRTQSQPRTIRIDQQRRPSTRRTPR